MMRFFYWTGAIVLLVLTLSVLFRGPIFRTFFHFSDLHERSAAGTRQKGPVPERTVSVMPAKELDACIDAPLDETANALVFTIEPAANDAAGALRSGRANCVGYAVLFQRTCEEKLLQAGLSGEWRVLHLRGLLYCGDFNLHHLVYSPFWKDHDICAIENRATGQRILVDPSLFDVARIRRVSGPMN